MTKRERMAAYREAARLVADGCTEYSCIGIKRAVGWQDFSFKCPDVIVYARMISPEDGRQVGLGDFARANTLRTLSTHRVLALLLAAEMVRTGDL